MNKLTILMALAAAASLAACEDHGQKQDERYKSEEMTPPQSAPVMAAESQLHGARARG
jgi:hypothetical protein